MKSYDAAQFSESLNRLAEALDRRPISPKGIEVWFDALKEFPTPLVLGILANWAKLHPKFPTPAEVWKTVNDLQIVDRERAAAQLRAQARESIRFSRTPEGQRALSKIRTLVERPRKSPRAHWESILRAHGSDTIGHEHAQAALAMLGHKRHVREPGEDDEDRQA